MYQVPGLKAKGGRKFGRKEEKQKRKMRGRKREGEREGERKERGREEKFINSIYIYPISPTYSQNIKK